MDNFLLKHVWCQVTVNWKMFANLSKTDNFSEFFIKDDDGSCRLETTP